MKMLPKYSLKHVMIGMIGVAVVLSSLASASRGNMIGLCLASGFFLMSVSFVCLGIVYWSSLGLRRLVDRIRNRTAILFVVIGATWSGYSDAQTQLVPPGQQGYHVTVDNRHPIGGSGFCTVTVKLEKFPQVPVKVPEEFTVFISPQYYRQGRVMHPLVIEAGQSSAAVQLMVPEMGNRYRQLNVVIKRGITGSGSDRNGDFFLANFHSSTSSAGLTKIWISSAAIKDTGFTQGVWKGNNFSNFALPREPPLSDSPFSTASLGTMSTNVGAWVGATALTTLTQSEPVLLHPDSIPQSWVGISSTQMIFITFDELKSQSANHPALCRVLENWVAVGGTLVVFDFKGQWKMPGEESGVTAKEFSGARVSEILPMLLGARRRDDLRGLGETWMSLADSAGSGTSETEEQSEADQTISSRPWQSQRNSTIGNDVERVTASASWMPQELSVPISDDTKFLMCPHVKGRVIAVPDHFQKWKIADWNRLENVLAGIAGSQSRLFDSGLVASSYYTIPGLGEPPLKSFQVLMSLFVLVAGPGVLIVLKRTQQMQLFFVVVPLVALTTCLGLMGYVILIEGFDSFGRVQSVTWLDQRRESGVTQTRAMYYHGLRPAAYHFDSQEAPLVDVENGVLSCLVWQEKGELDVYGGMIAPRTPHTLGSIGSREMKMNLQLIETSDRGSAENPPHRFVNQLGGRVEAVLYRKGEGWFFAEEIADGQTAEANPVDEATALQKLSRLIEIQSPSSGSNFGTARSAGPGLSNEFAAVEHLRMGSPLKSVLNTDSYVAILKDFPELESRLPQAQFKNSLHIIIGQR
jgi:hypothetical protein